jgi:hypothetical protein
LAEKIEPLTESATSIVEIAVCAHWMIATSDSE